jgi:hypothetical protein
MVAAKRRLDDISRSPSRRYVDNNKENFYAHGDDGNEDNNGDLRHVVVELQEIVKLMQADHSRRIAELQAQVDRQQILIDRLRRRL